MGPARCGDVLLVESYAELRDVLVEVLEVNGFRVRAFHSAREALAGAVDGVGVVLVGVNGYQREQGDDLSVLERDWRGAPVPLVALASGDGGMRLPGVTRVLLKPVEEPLLCAVLEACLATAPPEGAPRVASPPPRMRAQEPGRHARTVGGPGAGRAPERSRAP